MQQVLNQKSEKLVGFYFFKIFFYFFNFEIIVLDSEEEEECTLAQLLLASIKVSVMYPFLSNSEQQLQARTVVNYAAALQWHLVYLRFLLHPDSVATIEEEQAVLKAVRSTMKQENETREKEMKEAMKKIRGMMQKAGPEAEKQTILRNGKEALTQQGRWVEMKFVVGIHEAVDAEGWARLESLTKRMGLMREARATQVFVVIFICCF